MFLTHISFLFEAISFHILLFTRTYDLEDAEFVSAEVEVEMKDAETGLIRKVAPVINFAKVSESSALPDRKSVV